VFLHEHYMISILPINIMMGTYWKHHIRILEDLNEE
jgi:hypothetical protein